MPPSIAKTILLIELLETQQPYNVAEVAQKYYAIVNAHGGSHISTVGKKIVCTLVNSDLAAETACDLMACNFSDKTPPHPVARMCVCQAPGRSDSKEELAQAIAAAVRELVKARPGQIVTTQETAENLSDEYEIRFGVADGSAKARVFEITKASKEIDDATRIVSPSDRSRAALAGSSGKQVHLRWRGKDQSRKEMMLHSGYPVITFGRDDCNDIVIDSTTASRRHGSMEYCKDGIYIIDDSTNGTYVFSNIGEKFQVHKGKIIMPARGYISLGEALGAGHPGAIQFVTGFSVG